MNKKTARHGKVIENKHNTITNPMSDIWYLDVVKRSECSWTGTTYRYTCTSLIQRKSRIKWTQTASKTASSGESIPEYQINEDEKFLKTLNAVLKAFGVYRRSYITEEGSLTGLEKHFKIEIRGIFFNIFNFGSQNFLFSLKNFLSRFFIW